MAKVCLLQTTAHNDKSGNGRKTIEWFEEFDRILGRRQASQSHFLLQSGTEMQLKSVLEDESDDKTEGTTVAYNYTAHLMKCRKLPHRLDTNNIIILSSVHTYDADEPPAGPQVPIISPTGCNIRFLFAAGIATPC